MKSALFLIIVLLLANTTLFAQQQKKKRAVPPSPSKQQNTSASKQKTFNPTQKKQIETLKKINELIQNGKFNSQIFFTSFYSIISEKCPAMQQKYMDLIEKTKESSQKAISEGNDEKSILYNTIIQAYQEALAALTEIQKAYKAGNAIKVDTAIENFLKVEKKIKALKRKPVYREWFSMKETEAVVFPKE